MTQQQRLSPAKPPVAVGLDSRKTRRFVRESLSVFSSSLKPRLAHFWASWKVISHYFSLLSLFPHMQCDLPALCPLLEKLWIMLVSHSLQGLRLGSSNRRAAALFITPLKCCRVSLPACQSQFKLPWSPNMHHIETKPPHLYQLVRRVECDKVERDHFSVTGGCQPPRNVPNFLIFSPHGIIGVAHAAHPGLIGVHTEVCCAAAVWRCLTSVRECHIKVCLFRDARSCYSPKQHLLSPNHNPALGLRPGGKRLWENICDRP